MSDLIKIILVGVVVPLFTVWLNSLFQSKNKQRHDLNEKRKDIFNTMIATRGIPMPYEFIKAFGSVPTYFGGKEFYNVMREWRVCMGHMNSNMSNPLFGLNELLYSMCAALNLDNSSVKDFYRPKQDQMSYELDNNIKTEFLKWLKNQNNPSSSEPPPSNNSSSV